MVAHGANYTDKKLEVRTSTIDADHIFLAKLALKSNDQLQHCFCFTILFGSEKIEKIMWLRLTRIILLKPLTTFAGPMDGEVEDRIIRKTKTCAVTR